MLNLWGKEQDTTFERIKRTGKATSISCFQVSIHSMLQPAKS